MIDWVEYNIQWAHSWLSDAHVQDMGYADCGSSRLTQVVASYMKLRHNSRHLRHIWNYAIGKPVGKQFKALNKACFLFCRQKWLSSSQEVHRGNCGQIQGGWLPIILPPKSSKHRVYTWMDWFCVSGRRDSRDYRQGGKWWLQSIIRSIMYLRNK